MIKKQIIAIGDSHSRSFANSDYFISVFMGTGKENNFTSDDFAIKTEIKLLKIMSHFKKNDHFMLVLGEPDCRWNTYNDWNTRISEGKQNKIIDSTSRFETSLLKIKQLYDNLIVYNVAPHTRNDQNLINQTWNSKISSFCQKYGIFFCNIYNEVLSNLDKYLIKGDHCHLNHSVQELVIKKLQINKKITNVPVDDNLFNFDQRFLCYTLKSKK